MANVKISDLTSAAAATGTQQFEVNDGFVSKKVTGAQILSYIEGEISSSPVFTGQVSLDDGTAATPSLTNTGDTNTGVFFPNADEVAISTGGTERVKVNSSGNFVINNNIELGHATDTTISRSAAGIITVEGKPVVMTTGAQTVEFAAGTVSLPSITTTGDTNTGIFFPAADTIAFTEGGVETFRFGSSGQLGVAGANYGTSGQVLTSGGASAAPSWATVSGITQTTGSAPYYGARAWVNFNGTGVVAINTSVNVTSITDNGTGDYTINFTTAMADSNISVAGAVSRSGAGTRGTHLELNPTSPLATGSCKIRSIKVDTSPAPVDAEIITAVIFR